jgi:hypothetical protein
MTRQGLWPARGYPELIVTKCVLPEGFRGTILKVSAG